MRETLTPSALFVSGFVVAVTVIAVVPWGTPGGFIVLIVLHLAVGLAVGRWWVCAVPIPLWIVVLAVAPCEGDLCDATTKAFFAGWYIVVGAALVAIGVGLRRLVGAGWRRHDSRP